MSTYSNSNSLFHYTRNYESLIGILRNGFLPNYCKETMINGDILGIPMVSFCDIPLTRADIHRKNYGKFAIGLTKKWGISNNINPLLYLSSYRINKAFENIIHFSKIDKQKNLNELEKIKCPDEINKFTSEHMESINKCLSSTVNDFMHTYIFAYSKMYENRNNKGETIINYNDNEWRYVIQETNKWFWNESEYNEWRGRDKKPKSTFESLPFGVNDIRYILVETENEVLKLIDSINKFKTIGGNEIISKNDKLLLMTKIMSVERLNDDF